MQEIMAAEHSGLTQKTAILRHPEEESKAQFYRMRRDGKLQIYMFV
jgi:hypothetical protein